MFWKRWEKEQPHFILIHLESKKKIPVQEGGGRNFHYYLIGSIKRKLLWKGTSFIMLSEDSCPQKNLVISNLVGSILNPL